MSEAESAILNSKECHQGIMFVYSDGKSMPSEKFPVAFRPEGSTSDAINFFKGWYQEKGYRVVIK